MKKYNTEQVNDLIRNRRSVFPKDYVPGQIVEGHIIEKMLENANWAPTHGKTEPWRFFVFTGEGLKKLGEMQAGLYKELTPPESFDENRFNKLLANPQKASHVIAIAMKRQESGKIPEVEEVEAVACAVQNMYLTATAYGAGAYWSSGGITYREEAKELFGLGEADKLLGFFYVGVPAKEPVAGKRGDVSQKVTWVRD